MLTPFEFSVPTKIIFGVGEVKKVGGEAARYGKKALLVTYDEDFVKKVGFSGSFLPGRHPFHYGLHGPPAEGPPRPGGQRPDDVAGSLCLERLL